MDPYTWVYVALWVVSTAYAYSRRPKPTTPAPGKSEKPVTEEGKLLCEVFGDVVITDPAMLYYAELAPIPIKKKGGKK